MSDSQPESIQPVLDARMEALHADPETLLARFDADGDGRLNAQEWDAVRAMVVEEILATRRGESSASIHTHDGERIGSYQVLAELGRGAQGETFLVRHQETEDICALKRLHMSRAEDWKSIELFEREAQALERLSHPGIPSFVEVFRLDEDGVQLCLVQEFIAGSSLAQRLMDGELFHGTKLESLCKDLLDILEYLHSHTPPVVHRDIKPSNIIMNDGGGVYLVDFGAVQFERSGGTTVVGTTGYMPPEQLMGRATPASDLYALGATVIHLATRRHPTDLPVTRMKFDWRAYASVGEVLERFLDRLIQPAPEDRFGSVREARTAFDRDVTLSPARDQTRAIAKPAEHALVTQDHNFGLSATDDVTIRRTRDTLVIVAPFVKPPVPAMLFGTALTLGGFAAGLSAVWILALVGLSVIVGFLTLPEGTTTLKFTPQRLEWARVINERETARGAVSLNDVSGPVLVNSKNNRGLWIEHSGGKTKVSDDASGKELNIMSGAIRAYLADIKSRQ